MKRKIDTLVEKYTAVLESFEVVDSITFAEQAAEAVYDPYSIIELEAFYNGALPDQEERKKLFGNPAAFETSRPYATDRFLTRELPVIIYYRDTRGIDALFDRITAGKWVFRRETSHLLYRLRNSRMLYRNSDWLNHTRDLLENIPDSFWENILASSRFLVENALMELEVALVKGNGLLYQHALSDFIRTVSGFVFAINRRFTPPSRLLSNRMRQLERIPDEFINRFEGIGSQDNGYEPEKKVEIAKLLVKSLISLELWKS